MIKMTLVTKELLWWYGPAIFSALSCTSLTYTSSGSFRPLEILAATWLGGNYPYFSVPMSLAALLYCAATRSRAIQTKEPARS